MHPYKDKAMKTVQMIKTLTTGAILTTNIMVVGLAHAQAQQSAEATASVVVASNEQKSDSTAPPVRDLLFRSGYNVGRDMASHGPKCAGPVSFCNLYSGN
jgi:type II secretory pathway component GspD/PulD (secretin)